MFSFFSVHLCGPHSLSSASAGKVPDFLHPAEMRMSLAELLCLDAIAVISLLTAAAAWAGARLAKASYKMLQLVGWRSQRTSSSSMRKKEQRQRGGTRSEEKKRS